MPSTPRTPSPRALVPAERQAVLDALHNERFLDQSPAEVHAALLEEQTYLCSSRTMYRVLAGADEVRERRAQARHPVYTKPGLVATGPNQVSSWDITKLKGPAKYLYFSLYVILDLFRRCVVGWMVALNESARLAERLIEATCPQQGIVPQCARQQRGVNPAYRLRTATGTGDTAAAHRGVAAGGPLDSRARASVGKRGRKRSVARRR